MKTRKIRVLLASLFLIGIVLLLSSLALAEEKRDMPPIEISQPTTSITSYDSGNQAGDDFVSPAYTPPAYGLPSEPTSITNYDSWNQAGNDFVSPAYTPPAAEINTNFNTNPDINMNPDDVLNTSIPDNIENEDVFPVNPIAMDNEVDLDTSNKLPTEDRKWADVLIVTHPKAKGLKFMEMESRSDDYQRDLDPDKHALVKVEEIPRETFEKLLPKLFSKDFLKDTTDVSGYRNRKMTGALTSLPKLTTGYNNYRSMKEIDPSILDLNPSEERLMEALGNNGLISFEEGGKYFRPLTKGEVMLLPEGVDKQTELHESWHAIVNVNPWSKAQTEKLFLSLDKPWQTAVATVLVHNRGYPREAAIAINEFGAFASSNDESFRMDVERQLFVSFPFTWLKSFFTDSNFSEIYQRFDAIKTEQGELDQYINNFIQINFQK